MVSEETSCKHCRYAVVDISRGRIKITMNEKYQATNTLTVTKRWCCAKFP